MVFFLENKKLSIITASFNSEKTIKKTIESVLNQTNSNFEYIIVDGNSTDNTLKIIKSFEKNFLEKKIPFYWISEKDTGIYDAFNKGIKLAKGEWISFLGSDDVYTVNALKNYEGHIQKLKQDIDFIHSNVQVGSRKIIKGSWSWKVFRRSMNLAHVGAFHHNNYFKKYGLFDISYVIAGDYELLLRAKSNLKTYKFDKTTAIMGENGISNKNIKKVYLETTRGKIETSNLHPIICYYDYYKWLFKSQIKKLLNAFIR